MSMTDAAPGVNAAKTKAQTIDEWTAELEAIAIEVAVGIAGIAGGVAELALRKRHPGYP